MLGAGRKICGTVEKYDPSMPYSTSAGGAGTEINRIVPDVQIIIGPAGMKNLVHMPGRLRFIGSQIPF